MRNTMKMTLAALASLALIPTAVTAHTVKAPHIGTVTATTYYPSGAFNGAVDIAGDSCGYWGVETGVVGSLYWNITIYTADRVCNVATNNQAMHVFADGWTFRILHFLKTADSYDRTCDRCQIGDEGVRTRLQKDKNGVKDTSWYAGYTTTGEAVDRTETIGVLD